MTAPAELTHAEPEPLHIVPQEAVAGRKPIAHATGVVLSTVLLAGCSGGDLRFTTTTTTTVSCACDDQYAGAYGGARGHAQNPQKHPCRHGGGPAFPTLPGKSRTSLEPTN